MLSKFNEIKTENYSFNENDYKLTIFKSEEGEEIRVNISKNEKGQGILWTLQDLELPSGITDEAELVEKCLLMAKAAIQKNDSTKEVS